MKRIIALVLAMTLMIGAFSSCAGGHFSFDDENANSDAYITRGDWATLLGQQFGMDSSLSSEPYYKDVQPSSSCFSYVQSCVEWEVFSLEDTFAPDEPALVDFVIASAVKAAEADTSAYEDAVDFAWSNNLPLSTDKMAEDTKVTLAEANAILGWALDLFDNREFKEYENIQIKDEVKTLASVSVDDNGTAKTNEPNLKVGDVIITAPTAENPMGVARKITAVTYDENGNATIETAEPEIGEVYNDLDFACAGTIEDVSLIQTPEGVTVTELADSVTNVSGIASTDLKAQKLNGGMLTGDDVQKAAKGKNFSFSVKLSSKKKLQVSTSFLEGLSTVGEFSALNPETGKEYEDLYEKTGVGTAQLDDFKIKGDTQTIKATEKYSAGWEIEGSFALKNFYVTTEVKTKKAFGVPYDIKSIDCEAHYEVESSLKFIGKYEQEMTLATVPIPIGSLGVTVDFEIKAVGSVTGEVTFKATMANTVNLKYTEKSGFKKTQNNTFTRSMEISVNFTIGFGAGATVKVFGIKLINVSVKCGVGFRLSAKATRVLRTGVGVYYKYDESLIVEGAVEPKWVICLDGSFYYPTVSVELGTDTKTLAHKVGIKLKAKIVDISGAPIKSKSIPAHFEPGNGFVDECTLANLGNLVTGEESSDAESVTSEETSEATSDASTDANSAADTSNDSSYDGLRGESIDLSQYAVFMKVGETASISATSIPKGYTAADIVWSVDDDSVVKVLESSGASCTLKAVGEGVTYVIVKTADDACSMRCAVNVTSADEVSFTPLD